MVAEDGFDDTLERQRNNHYGEVAMYRIYIYQVVGLSL